VNVTYLVCIGTIDSFVASVLENKASLIDAIVEGEGIVPADVLSQLEVLVSAHSPDLIDVPAAGGMEDPVDRLLREVSQSFEQKSMIAAQSRRKSGLARDAIAKLAEALAGAPGARYRIRSGRKADVFYVLEADGPDVTCSCPGFEYRGNCTHARRLKAALGSGQKPPGEFELTD
jgi:hypothetical protein